jgi:hypothetical protein
MGDRPVATPVPAHGKTRTNIHASNGTHDPSIQAVDTHALDRATTVIGNLCSSPSIIMDDQVWEMRWTVGCIWRSEMHEKFWSENLKGRGHLEDKGVDG